MSEAVARNQEEAVNRRDLERSNNIDDDGKGSVAVRYNEASIVAPDYEDEEEDAKVAHRSEVENSDDISPENSAIDSSDVDDDENGKRGKMVKNGKNGVNSVSSVSSIIEAQASDSSTISSREKNLTTEWFK